MALARLEAVLNDVKADLRTVKQAALAFREALRMQSEQCTALIQILQVVRRKTTSCLEFLEREPVFWEQRTIAMLCLQNLDGEKTASLILRLDAFRDLLSSDGKGRQKSRMQAHIRLQTDLTNYVKHLQDLIEELEQVPPKVRAFRRSSPLFADD